MCPSLTAVAEKKIPLVCRDILDMDIHNMQKYFIFRNVNVFFLLYEGY